MNSKNLVVKTDNPEYPLILRGWAELSVRDVNALREYFLQENDPVCPYDFAHTRHWCGNNACRDS